MSEIEMLIKIISENGVSAIMLGYFIYNNQVTMRNMSKIINKNTLVLTRLLERMDEGEILDESEKEVLK